MSAAVHVEDGGERRRLGEADFPVPLGGPGSPVVVPGSAGPVAWLGLAEGEVFVQPAGGVAVLCNDQRLAASHWLRDGDVLRLGSARLEVRVRADGVHLVVERFTDANPTEPPIVLVPPPRQASRAEAEPGPGVPIVPVAFTPGASVPRPRPRIRLSRLVAALVALAVLAAIGFLAVARSVEVAITPEPDRVSLRGTLPALRLGSRFLAVPGRYTLVAEKAGYKRLEAPVDVGDATPRTLRLALARLPGRLVVDTGAVKGADVLVDGRTVGTTPMTPASVPAGEREVVVRAEGYVEFRTRVEVEGRGTEQRLDVALVPNSARVSFRSSPPGATVEVDGRGLGTTPLETPVSAGKRAVRFVLDGFKPVARTIEVAAGVPLTVPTATLVPADGMLVLASDPPGAGVTVDGRWRGETPIELALPPRRPLAVRLAAAGYEEASLRIELRPAERREETVRLVAQVGKVTVEARPPDAELLVDGESRGPARQTLELTAAPHQLEIRRDGYRPHKQTVTPRPGFPEIVRVALESDEEAREKTRPSRVKTREGFDLRLVEGLRIKMGAPRREPGRRANEPLRDVELVRPFYISTTEVSNAQFHRFAASHSSGQAGGQSLEIESYPVVRVTWEAAAAYCNWLSGKEGLPPAYVSRGGRLAPAVPLTTGYRLPTEAEWARVARYPDGRGPRRYPWGEDLPVPPQAGNYADRSAAGILQRTLPDYDDGYPATSPVDAFAPNALGLFNLGGNVAEWVHDFYTVTPSVEGSLVRDPTGPAQGEYHVIRGASWMDATVTEIRLSYRDYGSDPRPDVGFRVARYAERERSRP
jgi:formylglycine-generating enzyme required for sulfatase activity